VTTKGQRTGMQGVFLVAAEMAARGLIVSPTSRSAFGADLLVTDETCGRAYSVQVKTNGKPASFWLVGRNARKLAARSHIYVFVNIDPRKGAHEYYIVPSGEVAKRTRIARRPRSTWYSFRRDDALSYRDRWSVLIRAKVPTHRRA